MCVPLFCTGETDCIRRTSPFCLSSVVVASSMHILDREVSVEVDRLSAPSSPECRPGPSLDSSVLHITDTSSIPDIHSRETLSVRQGADNPRSASPILPLVGFLDGSKSRSMVAGITVGEGCWLRCFPFVSPQLVVPVSQSGVDFLSPALPVVSSREFRPESSDTTELWKLHLRDMSVAGIDASGMLPFPREIFRLELLAVSGRGVQLLPHMLESLAFVELCSRHDPQLHLRQFPCGRR